MYYTENGVRVRPPVLVVAHADGHIEVFGESIDVHIVTPIVMYTQVGEQLADEYLDVRLPHRHRDLHTADKLLVTHQVKPVRPTDEAARLLRLELVREAMAIRHDQSEVVSWT
ncbi:MAG: hypothetical protein ACOX1P_23035 [Thermoguttaceae bacterium]|jgi:hypothetical protein